MRYSLRIWMKLKFFRQIFEKRLGYQVYSKSVQWEPSCCMRTDGRTNVTKLIVAFRILANAPKKLLDTRSLFV